MLDIKTVTVVGVTGTMGANVAGIFASFGGARVYCLARDFDRVKKTLPRIVKSVRADAISSNLIPCSLDRLEDCVAESDLVFESAAESFAIKSEIASRVGACLPQRAISCTGTSGLSIEKLSHFYPVEGRERFFGVHMFNPPYVMSLCELISAANTNDKYRLELREYLEKRLHRTVVEVRDAPAFLGNRIGFQFINEALQFAERYSDSGGVDYIDAIMGPFTGRAMAPLATSDFVGLDVHKAIVDNVYKNTNDYAHETFRLPSYLNQLIKDGRLGRKAGGGLYRLERQDGGQKRKTVFDIATGTYRDEMRFVFPFAEKMKHRISEGDYAEAMRELVSNHSQEAEICLGFMLRYILYSIHAADEVAYSVHASDDVMATGFNWCPPLAMLQAISSVTDIKSLVNQRLPELVSAVDVEKLLAEALPSEYDYRPFFRSGR